MSLVQVQAPDRVGFGLFNIMRAIPQMAIKSGWALFLSVLIGLAGLHLPGWADHGSSQTVMSLIVPPVNTNNIPTVKTTAFQFNSAAALYNSETSVSMSYASGNMLYQIWVEL